MTSGGTYLALALALICSALAGPVGHALGKRSIEEPGTDAADYADYELQKPMPKRAALLLDRLLVALQKAVENEPLGNEVTKTYTKPLSDYSDVSDSRSLQLSDEKLPMDLQRRGQAKGRVYWRCYFNAVTCFKKK